MVPASQRGSRCIVPVPLGGTEERLANLTLHCAQEPLLEMVLAGDSQGGGPWPGLWNVSCPAESGKPIRWEDPDPAVRLGVLGNKVTF